MKNIIAIDTETGGLRPSIHPLLSIAAVASWCHDQPFVVYMTPYLPWQVITPKAQAKNGYSPELWASRGALRLFEAMPKFNEWLSQRFAEKEDAVLVAHNAAFDRSFLDESYAITNTKTPGRYSWRCSMNLFSELMDLGVIAPGSASLERLGELSGFWEKGSRPAIHDALVDARACLHGYQWLLAQPLCPKLLTRIADDLRAAQSALDGILPYLSSLDAIMDCPSLGAFQTAIHATFAALGTTPKAYREAQASPLPKEETAPVHPALAAP